MQSALVVEKRLGLHSRHEIFVANHQCNAPANDLLQEFSEDEGQKSGIVRSFPRILILSSPGIATDRDDTPSALGE